MTAFEEFGVIPELSNAISSLNWILPTAVQSEAIPAILGGADTLIAAETGSGKTGAFCVPISQIVWERRKDAESPRNGNQERRFVLNRQDRDPSLHIDQIGLNCESRVRKEWHGSRCLAGVHTKGKYFYEVTIERDGLCRIGWASLHGSRQLGTDRESFGFGGTGKKSHAKQFSDYGESFTTGDVIGCYYDVDSCQIWWSKNGKEFAVGFRIDNRHKSPTACLFPAVLLQNCAVSLNFGETPFRYAPCASFQAFSKAPFECVKWWTSGEQLANEKNNPLCVILEPTRELVQQTFEHFQVFAKQLSDPQVRCTSLSAAEDIKSVARNIERGTDVIVGTPARVLDLIQTGRLAQNMLQFIVIDEVDQFLADKNGGSRILDNFFKLLPLVSADGNRRQVIACSATLHNSDVARFADRYMCFPQWIDLKGADCVSSDVHHVICRVNAKEDKQWIRMKYEGCGLQDDHVHDSDKIRPGSSDRETISLGTKILKGVYVVKAIRALRMDKAIVFCRTKLQCDHMEEYLKGNGLVAACLHGDRSPEERQKSLNGFKNNTVNFLICTDVVARGLDVQGVPFVINVTLPDEKSMYVHRIGRVGRAERMGLSISLVSENEEKMWYHKCRSRGVGCNNTRDISQGGCTIWFDELKMVGEIEEHLGSTIAEIDSDFNVPVDEFDGKVVYGQKRVESNNFTGHVISLATTAIQLADLESRMQFEYLNNISYVFEKS